MILRKGEKGVPIGDMDFSSTAIWIQAHNLPTDYMHKENAHRIGIRVGKVIEVDLTEDGEVKRGKSMYIKVEMDIGNPLKCGFFMPRQHMEDLWIQIWYERLFDFCFRYGKLGHSRLDCPNKQPASHIKQSKDPHKNYGPWLLANVAERRSNRTVDWVPSAFLGSEDTIVVSDSNLT